MDTIIACDLGAVRPRVIAVEAELCDAKDRASIGSVLQRDGSCPPLCLVPLPRARSVWVRFLRVALV